MPTLDFLNLHVLDEVPPAKMRNLNRYQNTYVVIKFVLEFCLKEKGIVFYSVYKKNFVGGICKSLILEGYLVI